MYDIRWVEWQLTATVIPFPADIFVDEISHIWACITSFFPFMQFVSECSTALRPVTLLALLAIIYDKRIMGDAVTVHLQQRNINIQQRPPSCLNAISYFHGMAYPTVPLRPRPWMRPFQKDGKQAWFFALCQRKRVGRGEKRQSHPPSLLMHLAHVCMLM